MGHWGSFILFYSALEIECNNKNSASTIAFRYKKKGYGGCTRGSKAYIWKSAGTSDQTNTSSVSELFANPQGLFPLEKEIINLLSKQGEPLYAAFVQKNLKQQNPKYAS